MARLVARMADASPSSSLLTLNLSVPAWIFFRISKRFEQIQGDDLKLFHPVQYD
jgi:hypothetical protein